MLKKIIDPQTRPVVIIILAQISVRSSVRPHFSKYRKPKQTSRENNDRYWWDCGSGRGDHWWHMSCSFFISYPKNVERLADKLKVDSIKKCSNFLKFNCNVISKVDEKIEFLSSGKEKFGMPKSLKSLRIRNPKKTLVSDGWGTLAGSLYYFDKKLGFFSCFFLVVFWQFMDFC